MAIITRNNIDKDTMRIFMQTVLSNKRDFYTSLLSLVSKVVIGVFIPFISSQIFASMVQNSSDVNFYIGVLAATAIIGYVTNRVGVTAIMRLNAKGQHSLLETVSNALLQRSVGFHANNISGKLVSNALDYPQSYGKLLDTAYLNLIPFLLILVIGIVVVATQSILIAIALLIVCIVVIVTSLQESFKRAGIRDNRRIIQNNMVANLSDTLINTQAIKTFATEKIELNNHHLLSANLESHRIKDWTAMVLQGSNRMGWLLLLQVGLVSLIAYAHQQNPAILGAGIFAFIYTITLSNRLFEITALVRSIEEALLDASSMTKILLSSPEIIDDKNAHDIAVTKGEISLKSVSFRYEEDSSSAYVFKDLSLTIASGQKIGIVGSSGGGKSTLTRLLLRFEDIEDGTICIDHQDIRMVTQQSLRSSVAYVPQEPLLFHRSIKENIAYGKNNATQEEIINAAKQAFAHDFISQLPTGYETIVGERGIKLSGGQRQRIAIARAILKDAPILILDEATSALDSESEVFIQKALSKLMKNRTTLVIAHRLSTIQKMDRILVIDNGTIIEDGSHKQLIKNNDAYAKLWAHQSGGFIEE